MSLSVDRIDCFFFFFWCCVCCCVEYLVEECLSTKDEKVGRVSMCHTALTAGISYAAPQLVTRTLAVSFVRRRRVIGPSLKHNDTRCDVCVFPIFPFSSLFRTHRCPDYRALRASQTLEPRPILDIHILLSLCFQTCT